MKRLGISIFISLFLFFSLVPSAYALSNQNDPGETMATLIQQDYSNTPQVEAQAAILIDAKTGKIIVEKNINQREYPASTTKVMTALIVLENCNLTDLVTVGPEVTVIPRDSSIAALDLDEKINVETLLLGLMLPSGNDAAMTLAVHTARVVTGNQDLNYNEAVNVFVNLMNKRASELKLENTHFMNPHGYHDPDHYTSARDLSIIMQEALKFSIFRDIISTDLFTMEDWDSYEPDDPEKKMIRYWWNSDKLIQPTSTYYYPWAVGGKTGYTSLSKHCFVGVASQNGTDYISVVLNTEKAAKWTDSVKLFEYGFNNFQLYQPVVAGQTVTTVPVLDGSENESSTLLDVVAQDSCYYFSKKIENPSFSLSYEWTLPIFNINNQGIQFVAPITQGDYVGTLSVALNGELIQSIPLLAATTIPSLLPSQDLTETSEENNSKFKISSSITIAVIILAVLWLIYFIFAIQRRRRRMKRLRNPYSSRRSKKRY